MAAREAALNPSVPLQAYLLVAVGSGIGGAARLWLSTLVARGAGTTFPWGTLAVNALGCLLVGLLGAMFAPSSPLHVRQDLRVMLVVGVLGGFTTFSAYTLETMRMIERNDWVGASTYSIGSVIAGLIAVAIGLAMAKRVLG